jgi:hypothetical protein
MTSVSTQQEEGGKEKTRGRGRRKHAVNTLGAWNQGKRGRGRSGSVRWGTYPTLAEHDSAAADNEIIALSALGRHAQVVHLRVVGFDGRLLVHESSERRLVIMSLMLHAQRHAPQHPNRHQSSGSTHARLHKRCGGSDKGSKGQGAHGRHGCVYSRPTKLSQMKKMKFFCAWSLWLKRKNTSISDKQKRGFIYKFLGIIIPLFFEPFPPFFILCTKHAWLGHPAPDSAWCKAVRPSSTVSAMQLS